MPLGQRAASAQRMAHTWEAMPSLSPLQPRVAEKPPGAMLAPAEMAFPDPGEAGISRCVCGQELPTSPVLVCLAVG